MASREEILDAMLSHVPFDGWTSTSRRRAAGDIGLDEGALRLEFPGGLREMVGAFLKRIDAEMLTALEKIDPVEMKIRDRIRTAVLTRLDINDRYREAVHRTAAWLALPGHGQIGARALWRAADIMWRWAGDTSTDYNWYTKRAILSAVYGSTLMVWLNDSSDDYGETCDFLDRRIAGVMRFEKFKAQSRDLGERLPDIWGLLGRLRYPDRAA